MSLREGEDFYYEKSLMVFTKKYHLKKSYCCKNNCRHCPYNKDLKFVSMVPSWTETLLECDMQVVGRTRYCIYPKEKVSSIAIVGGTKDLNNNHLSQISFDVLLLDQEENPKKMSEQNEASPYSVWSTHIKNLMDLSSTLDKWAVNFSNAKLIALATELKQLMRQSLSPAKDLLNIPGTIEIWREPTTQKKILYLIWKDPWMSISANTFIASVFDFLGYKKFWPIEKFSMENAKKSHPDYFSIDLSKYSKEDYYILFSSEPYDFAKHKEELLQLGYACALIDAESYSWFGVRSIRFLQKTLASCNKNRT